MQVNGRGVAHFGQFRRDSSPRGVQCDVWHGLPKLVGCPAGCDLLCAFEDTNLARFRTVRVARRRTVTMTCHQPLAHAYEAGLPHEWAVPTMLGPPVCPRCYSPSHARLTVHRATWILHPRRRRRRAIGGRRLVAVAARYPSSRFYFGDSQLLGVGPGDCQRRTVSIRARPMRACFARPAIPLMLAGLFLNLRRRHAGDGRAGVPSAVLGTLAVGVVGWWTTLLFDAPCRPHGRLDRCPLSGRASRWARSCSAKRRFARSCCCSSRCWGLAWRATSDRSSSWLAAGGWRGRGDRDVDPPELAAVHAAGAGRRRWRSISQRRRQLRSALVDGRGFVVCMLALVDSQCPGHGPLRRHDVASRRQPVRRLNPNGRRRQQHGFVGRVCRRRAGRRAGADGDDVRISLGSTHARRRRDVGRRASGPSGRNWPWIKFVRIWNIWPNEPALRSWPLRLAVLVTYTPLLVFAVWSAPGDLRRGAGPMCWPGCRPFT